MKFSTVRVVYWFYMFCNPSVFIFSILRKFSLLDSVPLSDKKNISSYFSPSKICRIIYLIVFEYIFLWFGPDPIGYNNRLLHKYTKTIIFFFKWHHQIDSKQHNFSGFILCILHVVIICTLLAHLLFLKIRL